MVPVNKTAYHNIRFLFNEVRKNDSVVSYVIAMFPAAPTKKKLHLFPWFPERQGTEEKMGEIN